MAPRILLFGIIIGIAIYLVIDFIISHFEYPIMLYRIQQILAYIIAIIFLCVPFVHKDVVHSFVCIISSIYWIILSYNQGKNYKYFCEFFDEYFDEDDDM